MVRVASRLTKKALAETSVEASPAEVARTIKEIFDIIGISFKRQNINEMANGLNYMESAE
jgi:hypothetical protein